VKESEADEYLLCLRKVWKVISVSSYQEVLQGTAGYCFLPTFHWLVWPATAVGTVPVDMPDWLLWPCRQVLGPGDEPIVKTGYLVWPKSDQPDYVLQASMYTYTHVHSHCTHNTQTHTQAHAPLGQGEHYNLTFEPSLWRPSKSMKCLLVPLQC